MADVNYMAYAQAMGAKNPIAEGLNGLGSTMDTIRAQQMQDQQFQQAQTLRGLQIAALQREEAYKQGLAAAMANPRSSTVTNVAPAAPTLPPMGIPGSQYLPPPDMAAAGKDPGNVRNLRELGLMTPAPTSPFVPDQQQASPLVQAYKDGRVSSTTTSQSPIQAGMEYALANGKVEDIPKFIDVNKAMAAQAAQAKAYGSPEQAAAIDAQLEKMVKGATLLSSWKKAGGIEYMKAQAAKMPELFAGENFSGMKANGTINTYDLPNGQKVVWSDENPGQLHLSTAAKTENAYKVGQLRQRKSGRQVIEESYLGGDPNDPKSWKQQSVGASDAPHEYKPGRMYSVIDTKNGNMPIMMPADELAASLKSEPGRYLTAGASEKALKQKTLLEDIRGNVNDVREALKGMPEFSSTQAAQFSVALNDKNPETAMRSFFTSKIGQALTPQQQTYLIRLAQLHENAMAMRSVLGAGQGSDDVRRAIRNTIPNAATPTTRYAAEQLDRFETTLNRLSRGVLNVPLAGGGGSPKQSDPLGIMGN